MDLATIIGLIAGLGVVGAAIFLGGDFMSFVDVASVMIVIGGAIAATILRFTLGQVGLALVTALKTSFGNKSRSPAEVISRLRELSQIARKGGPLALQEVEIKDEFLRKGVQFIIDGLAPEVVAQAMTRERELIIERLDQGQAIMRAIGDAAPAFGMIGTLVGLVQMLSKMDDPSAIGPAMAVALLTTLYGALVASLFALPIADKLQLKLASEEMNLTLIAEGVQHIQNKVHPDLMTEFLNAYLPANKRIDPDAEPAAA
jgi:chemotaxis protein MotA